MTREERNYFKSLKLSLLEIVNDLQLDDVGNKNSYYNAIIERLKELAEENSFRLQEKRTIKSSKK